MEQKVYSFKPFLKWFAGLERVNLPLGDYLIAGLKDRVVFPERVLWGAGVRPILKGLELKKAGKEM